MKVTESRQPTKYWHAIDHHRIQCDLCPRFCKMKEGQRGLCFIRKNEQGAVILTSYGRSSGFCIDPIEKKPLNHFYPGSSVLSFGTAGCNLACKFCQNWDMSKSRELDTLMDQASPEAIARTAAEHGCRSVGDLARHRRRQAAALDERLEGGHLLQRGTANPNCQHNMFT